MMGRQAERQEAFFYAFRLEDRVPSDHLLRRIDLVLDLSDLDHDRAGVHDLGRASLPTNGLGALSLKIQDEAFGGDTDSPPSP